MRFRAVLFDLWQTLVVFPRADAEALYRRLAEFVGVPYERFFEVWNRSRPERSVGPIAGNMRSVCAELGFKGDAAELLALRRDWVKRALVPRPGALETLAELRRRGHRLGLITVCSEHEADVWEETAFGDTFDATVFSSEVGVSKPDPRIYRIACERLGVRPEECLYVGDGTNDELPGAERVGMTAVQLHVPGEQLAPEAEAWIGRKLEALEEVLALA